MFTFPLFLVVCCIFYSIQHQLGATLQVAALEHQPDSHLRPFLRLDIHFASSLYDLDLFEAQMHRVETILGPTCGFIKGVTYEPVVSATKNTYSLYTLLPSSLIPSDFQSNDHQSHPPVPINHSCSGSFLSKALVQLNNLPSISTELSNPSSVSHSQLLISHISPEVEFYPSECVRQIRNPNYIPRRSNEDPSSAVPTSTQATIDTTSKLIDHVVQGANCPKRGELTRCSSDDDCNGRAGSVCRFYFNRTSKRNEKFCSIVNRFKDYRAQMVALAVMLVAQIIYLVYVLSTRQWMPIPFLRIQDLPKLQSDLVWVYGWKEVQSYCSSLYYLLFPTGSNSNSEKNLDENCIFPDRPATCSDKCSSYDEQSTISRHGQAETDELLVILGEKKQ